MLRIYLSSSKCLDHLVTIVICAWCRCANFPFNNKKLTINKKLGVLWLCPHLYCDYIKMVKGLFDSFWSRLSLLMVEWHSWIIMPTITSSYQKRFIQYMLLYSLLHKEAVQSDKPTPEWTIYRNARFARKYSPLSRGTQRIRGAMRSLQDQLIPPYPTLICTLILS